jgi:hypothetical protein
MKLNPEVLEISSFETMQGPTELAVEGTGPYCDPTPLTACYACPRTPACPPTE